MLRYAFIILTTFLYATIDCKEALLLNIEQLTSPEIGFEKQNLFKNPNSEKFILVIEKPFGILSSKLKESINDF